MKKPSPLFLKKPLIIFALFSLFFAFSVTLFAQTTTGTSLITEMKAAVRIFNSTLKTELNPNTTEVLQSAPVSGKKIGDPLTAAEWNRMLELVAQGGGSGGTTPPPVTPPPSGKICLFTYTSGTTGNAFNSHMHSLQVPNTWTKESCRAYVMSSKGGAASVFYNLGCMNATAVVY